MLMKPAPRDERSRLVRLRTLVRVPGVSQDKSSFNIAHVLSEPVKRHSKSICQTTFIPAASTSGSDKRRLGLQYRALTPSQNNRPRIEGLIRSSEIRSSSTARFGNYDCREYVAPKMVKALWTKNRGYPSCDRFWHVLRSVHVTTILLSA